jgi:hypothetical protein
MFRTLPNIDWTRRRLLASAALAGAAAAVARPARGADAVAPEPLANATWLGEKLVAWQGPCGGPDPVKCPYRSKKKFNPGMLQGVGPSVRALCRLAEATGDERYGVAADRYATFFLATLHEPIEPYSNLLKVDGVERHLMSAAWLYGKALSPCYEEFVRRHPEEDAFELRALSFHRALQKHRRDDSYFGVGYPMPYKGGRVDCQFSCDLGEVGGGLVGLYEVSRRREALDDARGLAKYFLTDYEEGSGRGVWSPELGVWLVGPWPGGGAEHFTDQTYNRTGWGWSCWVDGDYLLRLRRHVADEGLRGAIAAKCLAALKWCLDACQFDDGAQGMFGRDDRWVGMTAVPVLLYTALRAQDCIPPDFETTHRAQVDRAWRWLLAHTSAASYPEDGYVKVTGKTTKKPPENLVWLTAWTIDALLAGRSVWKV